MSTTITYEGTMPGSRIQGELVERHADGSLTVVHPEGAPWTYRVQPERVIAEVTAPVTSLTHPTLRTLRDYLMEEQDWTQAEWESFELEHQEHFDGFQCTRLSWAEWEAVVMEYVHTERAAYTVRVMSDGQLLQDDVTFDDDQEHTARARFDSTVDYYRRSDPLESGVTVQMLDGSSDVLAEVTL